MEPKSKKGQVSFFIIAGIIIIIVFILMFVIRYTTTIITPERVVPPELVPVDNLITDCLRSNAQDAVTLIGINGGYIRFPDNMKYDPTAAISTNPIFKDDLKVPLWRHNGETNIPTEDQMKADIEWYIKENMQGCMDFEVFSSMFAINPKDNLSIDVELLQQGVTIEMDYPLEITSKGTGQVTLLNDFKVTIPSRLKTTYELARKIMLTENQDLFVERKTVDLIAMDVDIPYTDVEFDCTPKIWYVDEVEEKLKTLLTVNLPNIKVNTTAFEPIPEDQPYLRNHFVWRVTDTKYPTTSVSMTYDEEWPFFMHISPSEGNRLISSPTKGQDVLSFFCMNLWHYTYDVKYPVMVTVKDHKTATHDDYTFNFAFDVGINHNQPDNSNFVTEDFYYPSAAEEEFCKDAPKNILTVHTFENISRGSYEDHIELPGVDLTFTCLKMRCPIGESEVQFRGADVFSVEEVPYCIQGLLIGEKEGYLPVKQFVSTATDAETELYLTPVTKKEVEVVTHDLVSTGNIFAAEKLDNSSSVIITLKRPGFTRSAFYPVDLSTNDSYYDIDMAEIELLAKEDYTYEVTAYLIDDTNNMLGGYKANWTASSSEMESSDNIRFHVLKMPFTKNEEKLIEFLQQLEENSAKIPEPEFI